VINCFTKIQSPEVSLLNNDAGLVINSSISSDSHKYLYSELINIEDLELDGRIINALGIVDNAKGISLAVIFLDKKKNKLGGKIIPFNQYSEIELDEGTEFIKLGFRLQGQGDFFVYDVIVGSYEQVTERSQEAFSFPDLTCCQSTNQFLALQTEQPLILVETLFCDVETDDSKLARYFSYFCVLFRLIELQTYSRFYWMISISADKADYIAKLRDMLAHSPVQDKVFLNIYQHPEQGYDNDKETHIDRLLRPNVTIPELREKHTQQFADLIGQKGVKRESQLMVKLALDDDDFISPKHFSVIADGAISIKEKCQSGPVYVGMDWIGVIYHGVKGGRLDSVHFARTMHGAKYSVNYGMDKTSPFAIPENFPVNERYVMYQMPYPTFFYNRHAFNFSNSCKNFYYKELMHTEVFGSAEQILEYICNA
jgi:hypothetical protein